MEAWLQACRRQARGFLETLLRAEGGSLENLEELASGEQAVIPAFVEVLSRIRGGMPVQLSPGYLGRLEELRRLKEEIQNPR